MTLSDDEDENFVHFLESEILCEIPDEEVENVEEPRAKRKRIEEAETESTKEETKRCLSSSLELKNCSVKTRVVPRTDETGLFSKIPPELVHHILERLSSKDLVSCSLVCRFLKNAASDNLLWLRLYCMRWGRHPPKEEIRQWPCKKLYIEVMGVSTVIWNFSQMCLDLDNYRYKLLRIGLDNYCNIKKNEERTDFCAYSPLNDDRIILGKILAEEDSSWRSRGLSDKVVTGHDCSLKTCSYYRIGDRNIYICEKTGDAHECNDACADFEYHRKWIMSNCPATGPTLTGFKFLYRRVC